MEVAFHWFDPDSSMQHSKLVNAFLIEIAVAERKKKIFKSFWRDVQTDRKKSSAERLS